MYLRNPNVFPNLAFEEYCISLGFDVKLHLDLNLLSDEGFALVCLTDDRFTQNGSNKFMTSFESYPSPYLGLYGGLDVDDIHKKKGLQVGQKILDYMGSTELIANLFRISQTEEKLRKDDVSDAATATSVQHTVGVEVRKAIKEIGSTMPEDLPTLEKSIAQLEKEQVERLKKAQDGLLMLDE